MATLERELSERFAQLEPDQQRAVVEYARALAETPRRGVPGSALLRFAGTMPADVAREMAQAIEEGCEQVDPDAW